jgi:cytochrome c
MRNFVLSLATVAAALIGTNVHAEDIGKKSFEVCAACHAVTAGENGTGPSLHNLLGRTAGTAEGFRYSGPMKRSGIVWDEKNLSAFLRNPQEVVPGNRMPFSGVPDESVLKALVRYLATATK